MTEAQILQILADKRFTAPEWALIRHVNEGTGAQTGRTLDAVAMGLWPSRGLHLHGIEVKSSRSDWLRELKKPAKADGWWSACHCFWVAAPANVVQEADLPAGWGHLLVSANAVKIATLAQLREPPQLTWERVAALLRAACREGEDLVPRAAVHELAAAEVARVQADAEVQLRQARAELTARMKNHAAERFALQSGINFYGCRDEDAQRAGAAVRGGKALEWLENRLGDLLTPIEQLVAALAQLRQHVPQPEQNGVVEPEGVLERGESAEGQHGLHTGDGKTGS